MYIIHHLALEVIVDTETLPARSICTRALLDSGAENHVTERLRHKNVMKKKKKSCK